MSAVIELPFTLGSTPSSFKAGQPSSLSSPSNATLLPIGQDYVSHSRRQLRQLDFQTDDQQEQQRIQLLNDANKVEEDEDLAGLGEEEESKEILEHDPKEWKVSSVDSGIGIALDMVGNLNRIED